ncbi:uncharacterized protein C8orf48 homolog [Lytechinus variegatus]|uniref:uncharacterized protein C8orf48 homolog n=1 Tax=Lytechinus variegatus TaxID=7654 RepID=UPI001BB26AF6|nr:uncharacterized protein C8orf48 homolog [Lytechinus variegatus]XP_041456079.1 uncharacterized protein C8orf48 homolog [Lytechinus variegatus]
MFYSKAGRGGDSSSSSTQRSFHTANSSLESEDEIRTIIASSSDTSEIPSLVLGQRSYSSGWLQSSSTGKEDYESHYSTAKSSFDSSYRSDTFYTATTHSERNYSSSLYSSEFESDGSLATDNIVNHDFKNEKEAERCFLKAKLKLLKREKEEVNVEQERAEELAPEQNKFVKMQILNLLHKQKKALEPSRNSDKMKEKKRSKQKRLVSPPLMLNGKVEELKIQNLLHKMKRASEAPVHDVDQCENCRKAKELVVEREFVKTKHRHVYNQLTEERYRQHIINHDPLSEIGNLASALPKLSSDPQKVWEQLINNGIT